MEKKLLHCTVVDKNTNLIILWTKSKWKKKLWNNINSIKKQLKLSSKEYKDTNLFAFFYVKTNKTNFYPGEMGSDHWRSRLRGFVFTDCERISFVGRGRVNAQVAMTTAVPSLYDVTQESDWNVAAAGNKPIPTFNCCLHHGARVPEFL